jgi:phosphatidate cytidylyltransferase
MTVRIISGAAVLAIVCFIVFLGKEAFDVACVILSIIAINEFLGAFTKKGYKPLFFAGYISCFCMLIGAVRTWNRRIFDWIPDAVYSVDTKALLYISLLAMFCLMIFRSTKYSVSDLSVTVLGSLYVCVLFWYLILIRHLPNGTYIVFFVLLGATATDTCAYFVGTAIGRHKLTPKISPNKTVEGAVGGVAACIVTFVLFGIAFNALAEGGAQIPIPYAKYAAMGAMCGVVAQIGDLAASCIKRFCGIKDFGHLIPGHGGILDRLDSVLVLSPLIYMIFS